MPLKMKPQLKPYDYIFDFKLLSEWVEKNAQTELPLAFTNTPVRKNAIVLDLDDTLVCNGTIDQPNAFYAGSYCRVPRKHVSEFFRLVAPWYQQVCIFTSGSDRYAWHAVDELQHKGILGRINYVFNYNDLKLRRKDLTVLPNATLKSIVLVDDNPLTPPTLQLGNVLQFPDNSDIQDPFMIKIGVPLLRLLSQVDDIPMELARLKELWKAAGIVKSGLYEPTSMMKKLLYRIEDFLYDY